MGARETILDSYVWCEDHFYEMVSRVQEGRLSGVYLTVLLIKEAGNHPDMVRYMGLDTPDGESRPMEDAYTELGPLCCFFEDRSEYGPLVQEATHPIVDFDQPRGDESGFEWVDDER